MSRQIKLNKTSINKIETFLKNLSEEIELPMGFSEQFTDIVTRDVRMIKDCAEKPIVDFYIEQCDELVSKQEIDDEFFETLKVKTRTKLASKYAPAKTFDNTIDNYFNDVKREYILHPQGESDELAFIPENKETFIKNNLKLVINCAKRYRNLGLPFEDLIQIGNYGLLTAWEKFDTTRANLREAILEDITYNEKDSFSRMEAEELIRRNFKYSKTLDVTLNKLPKDGFATKQEFLDWANDNIKKASFSSIGFAWIRAAILLELNSVSKIIRVPKSAQKDDETKINIIRLDSVNPHTDDVYHDNQISEVANEEFAVEDESIENVEKQNLFKELIDKLLNHLSALDNRIIKKRFGIGVPYQLSINEIAENEGISVNKVKYSISNSMNIIAANIPAKDKETIIEMLR